MGVFDELLGDGGRALFERACLEVVQSGFGDPPPVEAAVGIEAFVLYVDEGVAAFFVEFVDGKIPIFQKERRLFDSCAVIVEDLDGIFREGELVFVEEYVARCAEIKGGEAGEREEKEDRYGG